MRLGLIPVGNGVKVVRTRIGMAVFDCRLKGFSKRDGRIEMEPVDARTATGEFRADNRRTV